MKEEKWGSRRYEKRLILKAVLIGMILGILLFIGEKCYGQRWKDSNRGLYPQSIQATYNVRNTALGFRYGYLFNKPVMEIPLGVYVSFSNTINPYWNNNVGNNNYDWERKFSLGGSVQLPHYLKMNGFHTFFTFAGVYNSHPTANSDKNLMQGQYNGATYHTTNIGVDIGIEQQINHIKWHLTIDAINFLEYVELGAGITFYKLKR